MAGLRTEFVSRNIAENLYPDNSFVNFAVDETRYVNGVVVVRPQAGAEPDIAINRKTLPAQVNVRQDSDAFYLIKELTSNPDLLTDADITELNYDKKASLVMNHAKSMNKKSSMQILYDWVEGANGFAQANTSIRTSGANVTAHAKGATGNRKALTEDDLQRAMTVLDSQDIDAEGRYALLDSQMKNQLWTDLKTKYDLAYANMVISGNMNVKIHGFTLLFRSSLLSFTNAGTPIVKKADAAGETTDHAAVICWQRDMVGKAVSGLKVMYEAQSPIYYGDIMSTIIRAGGSKMRAKAEGILAIVQTT